MPDPSSSYMLLVLLYSSELSEFSSKGIDCMLHGSNQDASSYYFDSLKTLSDFRNLLALLLGPDFDHSFFGIDWPYFANAARSLYDRSCADVSRLAAAIAECQE